MINKNLDVQKLRKIFSSSGTRSVSIEELFDPSFIRECEKEFKQIPEEIFLRYSDPYFEYEKYALNGVENMPSKIRSLFDFIHSREFIDFISEVTGLEDLYVDEKRWGGGLHKTKKGGYLSIHKDFTVLPTSYKEEKQMLRCINLIGYMTEEWDEKDGGHLEFWDSEGRELIERSPISFNKWVIFDTRDNYHGHPHPYMGEVPRMSIASYYYIKEKIEESKWSSTEYLKLPWMEDSEEYFQKRLERKDHRKRYQNLR